MKESATILVIIVLCLLIVVKAQSQKLPNIQEKSLRPPIGLKIDGRATEWEDSLQAYNKAVGISYAIANDDENLYLTIQASRARIITKIIDVGLTFTVNNAGKKKADAKETKSVTYPLLNVAPGQRILWYAGARARSGVQMPEGARAFDTTQYSINHVDSLIKIANNLFGINSKTIKVTGISAITDPIVSVYNEDHIKAVGAFNNAGIYTYELAIPLNYLGLSVNDNKQFSYNIKLESRLTEPKIGMRTGYIYPNGVMTDVDQDLDSTTDFWGTYTLAR